MIDDYPPFCIFLGDLEKRRKKIAKKTFQFVDRPIVNHPLEYELLKSTNRGEVEQQKPSRNQKLPFKERIGNCSFF